MLSDVSLHIDAGTRVAIVGETGSGKSTFAKLLTRLMDPVEGGVLLDGLDVRRIAPESLRRSVVLVPQEGFLFDDSIAANVRYGKLDATEAEILASADELGLRDWLDALPGGLATRVGPARRVAVGRGAPAGRAAAGPPGRPRPAGPRRGHQRGRPAARDAHRSRPGAAHAVTHLGDDRPPALDGRERRRGDRGRPGSRGAARARTASSSPRRAPSTPGSTPRGWPSTTRRLTRGATAASASGQTASSCAIIWSTSRCSASTPGAHTSTVRPMKCGDVVGAGLEEQVPVGAAELDLDDRRRRRRRATGRSARRPRRSGG